MFKKLKTLLFPVDQEKERLNWIQDLRNQGATIGKNVQMSPYGNTIDIQTPFLLNIGNNVCLAKGASILNHDYSNCVIRREFGNIHGGIKPIYIGDNVFVGLNSTILMGSKIGNNVIIGANSVVKGTIPDSQVWAGNPAHYICTTKQYMEKRQKQQTEEAKCIFKEYIRKFHTIPKEEFWHNKHYFVLWTPVTNYPSEFKEDFGQIDNNKYMDFMQKQNRPFSTYEDFIKQCETNL